MLRKLSLSLEFMEQTQKLPKHIASKVTDMLEKIRKYGELASLHIEPLHGMKNSQVRTARVDQTYRAVLLADSADQRHFVAVWVDHHDKAMAWAERKSFSVNVATGALQILNIVESNELRSLPAARAETRRFENRDLASLGIDEALFPSVEAALAAKRVDGLAKYLSPASFEALQFLVRDEPLHEVQAVFADRAQQTRAESDFDRAVEHPDAQRTLVTLRDGQSVESMLSGSFEAWRHFLHPDQRKLVEQDYSGPARVLGGPGTGKTVVAMHRAVHLARQCKGGERVLLTMFSKTLALDVDRQLNVLCKQVDPSLRAFIEVKHIDAWAADYLNSHRQHFSVVTAADKQAHFARAYEEQTPKGGHEHSRAFMRRELDRVVLEHELQHFTDYEAFAHEGLKLGRRQRKAIWDVIAAYRQRLADHRLVEWADVPRKACSLLREKGQHPYRSVIVDEAQDFSLSKWRLVRQLVSKHHNDLFLVGDEHQRIYGTSAPLKHAGIAVVGRSRLLRVNYRTTHQVAQYALRVVDGVELSGEDDAHKKYLAKYTSLLNGPEPLVAWGTSLSATLGLVAKEVKALLQGGVEGKSIAIVVPSRSLMSQELKQALDHARIPFHALKDSADSDVATGEGVRVLTMHRAKGLEFRHVFVAGLGDERFPVPLEADLASEPTAARDHEVAQRALLFVACTRARDTLHVSGAGVKAPFIPGSTS